jgi:hypothetical protein
MGRMIKSVEIEGQPATAMFDTGAVNTYVQSALVEGVPRRPMSPPAQVGLGGRSIEISELCLIQGKIEGLSFLADAVPVSELGRAEGCELDAIIGALTLERWEIKLDPKTNSLDLDVLRRREFTEFPERGT